MSYDFLIGAWPQAMTQEACRRCLQLTGIGGAQRATLLSSKSAAMITLDVDFFVAAVIALFFDLLRLGKKDVAI